MKNLAFDSLLHERWYTTNSHCITCTSLGVRMYIFNLGVKGSKHKSRNVHPRNAPLPRPEIVLSTAYLAALSCRESVMRCDASAASLSRAFESRVARVLSLRAVVRSCRCFLEDVCVCVCGGGGGGGMGRDGGGGWCRRSLLLDATHRWTWTCTQFVFSPLNGEELERVQWGPRSPRGRLFRLDSVSWQLERKRQSVRAT